MNNTQIKHNQPADYLCDFQKYYFEICQHGYSILERTPKVDLGKKNHWQFESGYPPSYSAQGRYRFLRSLAIAERLKPSSILEVACGGGFNGACLYQPERRIVLNDLRIKSEDVEIWTTGKHLEVLPGNLFELEADDIGQFELVMACEVLEHIAHGDKFVRKLKDLLSPEGILLLTTPNGLYFRSNLPTYSQITDFTVLEDEQFKPDADGHLFLYTPDEIINLLEQEGFKNINVYLSITPFISGHLGLRFLPSIRFLLPLYFKVDKWLTMLPNSIRKHICFQIIVTASIS